MKTFSVQYLKFIVFFTTFLFVVFQCDYRIKKCIYNKCRNKKICHIWSDKSSDKYIHFLLIKDYQYKGKEEDIEVFLIKTALIYSDTVQHDLPIRAVYFQRSLKGFHCELEDPSDFFDFNEIQKNSYASVSLSKNKKVTVYNKKTWFDIKYEKKFSATKLKGGHWQIYFD